MDSSVQRERSRGADLPAQRWPPPFCSEIEQAFDAVIREAVAAASAPVTTPLRWTLKRLVAWIEARFQRVCGRETVRRALHRLKLSWKKARKLLGRADPDRREAFVEQIQTVLKGATHDQHLLVYLDEAHIHQDADLGYGWSVRGERLWVCSSSPGLSAKVSFYGLYLYLAVSAGQWRLHDRGSRTAVATLSHAADQNGVGWRPVSSSRQGATTRG